uniref:DNA damage-binding protein 1 n=1 Tax=Tetraselmis sp. GSL018 TaxID=582737 RepID=A0A061SBD9_9CHLO
MQETAMEQDGPSSEAAAVDAELGTACGSFTSANDVNLIIAKYTRIEIHTLTEDGLQGVLDVPIYGRISAMQLLRPKGEAKDLLFLLTERYKFCMLGYSEETGELVTRAHGDMRGLTGRPTDTGHIGIVDPECRVIGLYLYDGLFKVIPVDGSSLREAYDIRLEELDVIDLQFLHGCALPTLAVLFRDPKKQVHLKTYEIKDKDFSSGPWSQPHILSDAHMIIPVPEKLGGVIVICEKNIIYTCGDIVRIAQVKPLLIRAYGRIDEDGRRYLLSDFTGMLYLLLVRHDGFHVLDLVVEPVGKATPACTITYLDSGVVFLGSTCCDSQLIQLHKEPVDANDPGNYIEVLDSFANLGPIMDFCVVDLDRQGQGQVVTCSGVHGEGSLRIVRNGIGINEQANIELPGIRGIWSLRASAADQHDKYLVVTFVGETRILGLNEDDELEEVELEGLNAEAQTLHCANVAHGQVVQVTQDGIRLIDADTGKLLHRWSPLSGVQVNLAASSPSQLLVATGEGNLLYFEIGLQSLKEVSSTKLENEISCVDITPLGVDSDKSSLAAVGTWARELFVLSLPTLGSLHEEPLAGQVIPRSVLLAAFDGVHFLLCALGDGHLLNFNIDKETGFLMNRKKISLGTKPVTLRTFSSNGTTHVFAASDRPTVIYYSNKKLLYSNVNENEVNFMTSFNCASFPNSLAIASKSSMTIGTIDEIQKLHIRTVPLNEMPRRIAHQESSRTFGVITVQLASSHSGDVEQNCHVRLVDEQTFEVVSSFSLDEHELGCSILSCSFEEDDSIYYVVGTAYTLPEECDSSKGRLLVFQVLSGSLVLVAEREVKGAVYNLNAFQGGLLAGINSRIQLFRWVTKEDSSRELVSECSHVGHIMALYAVTRGDLIVVGDLMKSMVLLVYKPGEQVIEERARDYNSNWMSSVEALDDDVYIGAEHGCNLFTVRRNAEAVTDDDRMRLEPVGEMHLGEQVNRFRRGSLVMRLPDSELGSVPTVLFGTINGVIGVVASLPKATFQKLERLQAALRKVIKGVGGLSHAEWRSFENERKVGSGHPDEQRCFVDGDLIEQFLDLRRDKMEEVAAEMGNMSVDDIGKMVEELGRPR